MIYIRGFSIRAKEDRLRYLVLYKHVEHCITRFVVDAIQFKISLSIRDFDELEILFATLDHTMFHTMFLVTPANIFFSQDVSFVGVILHSDFFSSNSSNFLPVPFCSFRCTFRLLESRFRRYFVIVKFK